MSRVSLIVTLVIALAVGLLFGFFPEFDLRIAALFYDVDDNSFIFRDSRPLTWFRVATSWLLVGIVTPCVLVLVGQLLKPHAKKWFPPRAAIFLLVTLALGPGVFVNWGLKAYWSRPRPVAIVEFGGELPFVPWWDPRGKCEKSCSFVSGEAASAFWTLAPASFAPAPWRLAAYASALLLGTGMGIVRMGMGGHFFTDVAFSGIFTFLIIFLFHRLLYRFKPRS